MKKTLHFLLFLLSLSYFSKLNAQCGAQASANATIGCGSSYTVTASTNSVVYSVAPSSCTPVTISGTNAFPTACDDCVTGQIPLGFNFNFYGNTYNSVVISSNGLVGFGAFTFTGFTPFTIPAGGLPNNYIAGFMCDIDIRFGGTITYQMVGTAPNRRFVIRYNNVVPYNMGSAAGTGTASFQIVINENGSFQVIVSQLSANWNSSTSGALATSGAENINGTLAFPVPGRNNTDWPGIVSSAQDCHLFNPVPCIFTNWTVGGTVVSTSTNYNISPTAKTTYNANWNCGGTPCTRPVVITVAQRTLSLGTPTPNTGCGTPNGIIPLNFTNVPNGNYTLTYSLNGVPTTRTITVSAGAASLTGLSAGNYSAFSIPAIAGCSAVSAAGPVVITSSNLPSGTGVTICQGAPSQPMTSSFVCPITGSTINQGATFNSGNLAASDPQWSRNTGGTFCNGLAGAGPYYDVFSFTVSTAGSYTFNGCFPTIDGHASLYQNAFNGANPCGTPANFIIANDDSAPLCSADPQLIASLVPGVTYFIVSTSFSAGALDSYSWTFTGPAGATISTGAGPSGSLQWYTAASGGSALGTGTSFNPVGVAGSGLTNTNTAGTTTYYLACSSSPTCRTAINYVINAAPTAAVTGTNSICTAQSTTLTASGGGTYVWNTGASTAPITVTPAANTTYTVSVTSAAGCTATATRTVTVNPIPTASISGTTTVCATSSTALTASGGSSYSWSTGAGTTAINVSPAANTTYTVTVTSAAGCTATANATVTVNQPSTSPSLNAPGTICPNTTVLMTASGGTSGTGSQVGWYTGPNGTGTFLGFGNSFNWTPTATSTVYARREGFCNNTNDATATVTVRDYVYAANGTSSSTYCTDNAGWHHFYSGNNIILSVQGDLSNAGTVTATIRDNGAYYLDPGNTALCASGWTPGEAQFEMERNWNVQHTGSLSGTYNIRYYFEPAERTAVINAANNWMATYAACGYNYKYNAASNGWFWFKNQGSSYTAPDFDDDPSFLMLTSSGSGTTPNGISWATMSGVTNFSGGTGGIILVPSSLLPVEWLYFTGNTVDRINKLQWATASEENTREFEVQRSKDGLNFEVIGTVQAAGNSNIQNNYLFDDVNPYSGLNYYRLRLINNDNSAEFSETIVLEINEKDLNASIYPNPATDEITYSFNSQNSEDVRIVLIDALGRVLRERTIRSNVGFNNLKTDLSDLVPSAYNLRITHLQSGKDFSKKIIKK